MAEKNLLIVDDDPNACKTLSDIFNLKGYNVVTVNTAQEAFDILKEPSFDAALIDIKLPDMDGTVLLKECKKRCPEMVCCIITGHASLQNAIDSLKDGASGYFVKPLVIEEVLHRLEEAMDRQRLQRELSESEERYRTVVETASDAIISIDSSGKVVFWNRQAETIFGYSADELVGKLLTVIIPEQFRKAHREGLKRVVSTGKSDFFGKTIEMSGLRKDGSEFPLENSLAAWKTKDGLFFTCIIRDITKRKRTDEDLKQRVEELERFRKATIQREFRMKELKEEIQNLKLKIEDVKKT